ncbi:hypothetical protein CRE_14263 [Caenorhabditis remanei]|uniref:SANT domain-containing protein n=1 Tax=Caenorhabditis remanei TaxID=31234 RepID=E3N7P7_CAERE|nr:hypothetical protein CRE_14263 [Caenorhabditis remanei]
MSGFEMSQFRVVAVSKCLVSKCPGADYFPLISEVIIISLFQALYILRKENLDFDSAAKECGKRKEIKETWTEEEVALFTTSYFNFGKKFRKIKAVMPNRSLHSIVNYYYQTKKVANYKTNIGIQLNETDKYDELMNDINGMDRVEAGYCENCNQKSCVLIVSFGGEEWGKTGENEIFEEKT